uniref:Uncharacterized protein n=1 Tax=Salix viminalis TaxID=40686 RepID=A0A6N2M820_SALVM
MTAGEGKPAANSVLNQPLPSHSTGTQIGAAPLRNGLFSGPGSCRRELESRRGRRGAKGCRRDRAGEEAVHARDFIEMETGSTCTVTFFRLEAQETTPLMSAALEKHGSLSLSRCLQHAGPAMELDNRRCGFQFSSGNMVDVSIFEWKRKTVNCRNVLHI